MAMSDFFQAYLAENRQIEMVITWLFIIGLGLELVWSALPLLIDEKHRPTYEHVFFGSLILIILALVFMTLREQL